MKSCRKKLGGVSVELYYPESASSEVLINELGYYPDTVDETEMEFCFFKPDYLSIISNNPTSHFEYKQGFGVNWGGYSVVWTVPEEGEVPKVYFYLNVPERKFLNKLKGMQFTHPFEEVGQLFHEGVLQTSLFLYFSDRLSLIHGSAVKSPQGSTIVFGGTGGVGKTSLELELMLNRNFEFIADDITILGDGGKLAPNFNLPKIYGYNLLGYKEIEKNLFKGKSKWDKLWWQVQKQLRKPNKFRRRADLNFFYEGKIATASKIDRFFMLYRGNVPAPRLSKLTPDEVASMNSSVLYTELTRLSTALKLHEFNRKAHGNPALFNFDECIRSSGKNLKQALQATDCQLLEVPLDFTARNVKESIPDLIGL